MISNPSIAAETVMGGVGPIIPETVATVQLPMVEITMGMAVATETETIAHPGQMVVAMGTVDCLQSNFSTCKS